MAELAPGLFVSDWITPGFIYQLDLRQITGDGDSGMAGTGRGVALSTSTWRRIDGAERERLLDDLTRRSAEWGIERLAGHLARVLTEGDSGG
jgi:hypothetical protein